VADGATGRSGGGGGGAVAVVGGEMMVQVHLVHCCCSVDLRTCGRPGG
jgi:hypothetical protein